MSKVMSPDHARLCRQYNPRVNQTHMRHGHLAAAVAACLPAGWAVAQCGSHDAPHDLRWLAPGEGHVCAAQLNPGVAFNIVAGGVEPFWYQWSWQNPSGWVRIVDGVNNDPGTGLPLFTAQGATTALLTISDWAGPVPGGLYMDCEVSNACGTGGLNPALSIGPYPWGGPLPTSMCATATGLLQVYFFDGSVPHSTAWQWLPNPEASWIDLAEGWNSYQGAPAIQVDIGPNSDEHYDDLRILQYPFGRTAAFRAVVSQGMCGPSTGDPVLLSFNSADFNGDGDVGTDSDIEAYFQCLAGDCCATCGSADFDANGDVGTDADIAAFFRLLAGGTC
jgi:hypothetical protein